MAICNLPADQDCGYPQCQLHGGKVRHHEHDLPKLKGNQNVRNTQTGEFAKETERFDAERVVETDKEKADGRSPLERSAAEAIAWLVLARSEEELNLWFADYVQIGCELRGQRLRELTERHIEERP